MLNNHPRPNCAKCCVSTDTNCCYKHPQVNELDVPKVWFGCPNINLLFRHHPIPIWLRIPCPVSSSVPRPIMNPIMAKRPFQVSAKEEKPNLLSIESLGNFIGVSLGLLRQMNQPDQHSLPLSLTRLCQHPGATRMKTESCQFTARSQLPFWDLELVLEQML